MPSLPYTTQRRQRRLATPIRSAARLALAAGLVGAALLTASIAPLGPAAEAHAASGPKAYVGLFKENAVAVLDTASGTVTSKIAVPTGPHGVAATPDGKKVYVSSDGATTVSVIDTATDSISK